MPSLPLVALSCVAFLITLALPLSAAAERIFGFALPTINQLGLIGVIAIGYFVVNEVVKLLFYYRSNRAGSNEVANY